jgi:hypothetical protein
LSKNLGVRPDLLLLGTSFPEAVTRQFSGAMAEEAGDGGATPVVAAAGDPTTERQAFIRDSYMMADEILAAGRDLLGSQATALVVSPGGYAPSWLGVNAGQVLVDAGIAESEQPANCVPGSCAHSSRDAGFRSVASRTDGESMLVRRYGADLRQCRGREPAGAVTEDAYESTRDAVVAAFSELQDPNDPDAPVIAGFLLKENLRDVAGADALHPSRSADVTVVLAPPYRFDNSVSEPQSHR